METCKTCSKFIENDNPTTGSCLLFGDKKLIAENSAVFDPREDELYNAEVGENFGCIHHNSK